MPTFTVYSVLHVGVFTTVEAKSEKRARRIALERSPVGLCHQCGGSEEEAAEEWCVQDWDSAEVDYTKVSVECDESTGKVDR